jgi:hypothetical protein
LDTVPVFHFDRSKPFYPWVVHAIAAIWGFKELLGYGAGVLMRSGEFQPGTLSGEEMALARAVAESRLKEVMPPLALRTEHQGQVDVEINDIAIEIALNHAYLVEHTQRSMGTLLVVTFEATHEEHSDNGELWEFFRHCRNAAGHGGRFDLLHGEPRRPAKWQTKEITPDLHGKPLFRNDLNQPGFLEIGDPIGLLWDVERSTSTF